MDRSESGRRETLQWRGGGVEEKNSVLTQIRTFLLGPTGEQLDILDL